MTTKKRNKAQEMKQRFPAGCRTVSSMAAKIPGSCTGRGNQEMSSAGCTEADTRHPWNSKNRPNATRSLRARSRASTSDLPA